MLFISRCIKSRFRASRYKCWENTYFQYSLSLSSYFCDFSHLHFLKHYLGDLIIFKFLKSLPMLELCFLFFHKTFQNIIFHVSPKAKNHSFLLPLAPASVTESPNEIKIKFSQFCLQQGNFWNATILLFPWKDQVTIARNINGECRKDWKWCQGSDWRKKEKAELPFQR